MAASVWVLDLCSPGPAAPGAAAEDELRASDSVADRRLGLPICTPLWVFVSIANCCLPQPLLGMIATVTPNVASLLWSKVAFGKRPPELRLGDADADAAHRSAAGDDDRRDLAWGRLGDVDRCP